MPQTLTPFNKIGFADSNLSRLENNVDVTFKPILSKEILDGKLIDNISLLAAGTTNIEHGLQRAVNGYIVVKKSANSTIWDTESTNTMKDKFLQLKCSANVTVSLWVF